MAASWARRSFAAATICIALVILRVALPEAMRLRRSFRLAIGPVSSLASVSLSPLAGEGVLRREVLCEGIHHADQPLLGVGGDFLLAGDVAQDVCVRLAQVAQERLLELRHRR